MKITKKNFPAISVNNLCIVGTNKEIERFTKEVADKLKIPLFKKSFKKDSSQQIDENFWKCYELGGIYQISKINNIPIDIFNIFYWSIVTPSLFDISVMHYRKRHDNFRLFISIPYTKKYISKKLINFAFLDKFLIVELNK